MHENEIAKLVVDAAFRVHQQLGPGLLESVYEAVLAYELKKLNLKVECQKPVKIHYDDLIFAEGFRADVVVDDKIIIEIKSVEQVANVHYKQLLTYLKLTGLKLGLLINFNEALIKDGIKRIVNKLDD